MAALRATHQVKEIVEHRVGLLLHGGDVLLGLRTDGGFIVQQTGACQFFAICRIGQPALDQGLIHF